MKKLLIDVGSTSIKWTVDSEESGKGEVSRPPFPSPLRHAPPFFEVDPEAIWHVVSTIVEQAGSVDSIALSVQMHGYVLGDEAGRAVSPYVSWQDERASLPVGDSTYLEQFPVRIERQSGTSLKANLPAVSLYAMQAIEPEIVRRARLFFTLGSYLAFRLTGRNVTHLTDAAPSGFYDVTTCRPSAVAPAWLSLPEAVESLRHIGLHQGIAVHPPVGDQQASVMGAGLESGALLLNLGTAAQLCAVEPSPCFGEFESRPYFNGTTLCTVTRLLGGRDMRQHEDDPVFGDRMTHDYLQAIRKLPSRKRLRVIGGAAQHYRSLIDSVCQRLALPYTVETESDALDGLNKLAAMEKTHEIL